MKYFLILVYYLGFSTSSIAQDKEFVIDVTIKKFPPNSMAYLQYTGNHGVLLRVLDSVSIGTGNFSFKGKLDEPRPASIVIRRTGKPNLEQHAIHFYLESGNTVFTSKSMIIHSSIEGSPTTDDQILLNKILGNGRSSSENMVITTRQVSVPAGQVPSAMARSGRVMPGTVVTSAGRTPVREEDLPVELRDAIAKRRAEFKANQIQYIRAHPKSFVSLYVIDSLWTANAINYPEFKVLLDGLDSSLIRSNQGKLMSAR